MNCEHSGITIKLDGIHELSPHRFEVHQKLKNVTVEILKCTECGEISIGWIPQADTEDITEEGDE